MLLTLDFDVRVVIFGTQCCCVLEGKQKPCFLSAWMFGWLRLQAASGQPLWALAACTSCSQAV